MLSPLGALVDDDEDPEDSSEAKEPQEVEEEEGEEEAAEHEESEEAVQDDEAAVESEADTSEIEIQELNPNGESVLQVLFQVDDAFTANAVQRNLKGGCVSAIQAAKVERSGWYDYDAIQCAGMMGQALNIGTAEFSSVQLAEISDEEMSADPEAFWSAADKTHIASQYE